MEKRPENMSPVNSEEQVTTGNTDHKNSAIVILAIVAAVLALVLAAILISKARLVHELQGEKDELTEQIVALQADYDSLSSDYESINSQLDSSREEVAQLIERIQKTDATNRRKIRQYQKELGTLRAIMKNYIIQIDSLNTLNHKLTADAAAARRDFDGGADMVTKEKTSAGQTSNKKPTKLHVRKPLCETFTFTDELTHHHKADAYKAYNSANENVGYVFMTDDQRTPAYGHCELHFYPDYQDRYQEWRRMTSNGERIKWETLCEKLKAEGRCEYFVD